jgi:hypothetical protein
MGEGQDRLQALKGVAPRRARGYGKAPRAACEVGGWAALAFWKSPCLAAMHSFVCKACRNACRLTMFRRLYALPTGFRAHAAAHAGHEAAAVVDARTGQKNDCVPCFFPFSP